MRSSRSTAPPTACTARETITAELRAQGWTVNHKRVERLMRDNGIQGMFKPAKVRTTIPAEHNPPLHDLVKRAFGPGDRTAPGSEKFNADVGIKYPMPTLGLCRR